MQVKRPRYQRLHDSYHGQTLKKWILGSGALFSKSHKNNNFRKIGKNLKIEFLGYLEGALGMATSKKHIGASILTKFEKL